MFIERVLQMSYYYAWKWLMRSLLDLCRNIYSDFGIKNILFNAIQHLMNFIWITIENEYNVLIIYVHHFKKNSGFLITQSVISLVGMKIDEHLLIKIFSFLLKYNIIKFTLKFMFFSLITWCKCSHFSKSVIKINCWQVWKRVNNLKLYNYLKCFNIDRHWNIELQLSSINSI